ERVVGLDGATGFESDSLEADVTAAGRAASGREDLISGDLGTVAERDRDPSVAASHLRRVGLCAHVDPELAQARTDHFACERLHPTEQSAPRDDRHPGAERGIR